MPGANNTVRDSSGCSSQRTLTCAGPSFASSICMLRSSASCQGIARKVFESICALAIGRLFSPVHNYPVSPTTVPSATLVTTILEHCYGQEFDLHRCFLIEGGNTVSIKAARLSHLPHPLPDRTTDRVRMIFGEEVAAGAEVDGGEVAEVLVTPGDFGGADSRAGGGVEEEFGQR